MMNDGVRARLSPSRKSRTSRERKQRRPRRGTPHGSERGWRQRDRSARHHAQPRPNDRREPAVGGGSERRRGLVVRCRTPGCAEIAQHELDGLPRDWFKTDAEGSASGRNASATVLQRRLHLRARTWLPRAQRRLPDGGAPPLRARYATAIEPATQIEPARARTRWAARWVRSRYLAGDARLTSAAAPRCPAGRGRLRGCAPSMRTA